MLTPDEGHLDRRIAQEASTIARRRGWLVDIFPAVDRGLRYDDALAPGVRLLATEAAPRQATAGRVVLRRLRRVVDRRLPEVGRVVEAFRYRRNDPARRIAEANSTELLGLPPYNLLFAHDVPVFPLAERLKEAWLCPMICDLHEVFPEQAEHFTTQTAKGYWRRVEGRGLRAANGVLVVNDAIGDYVHGTHSLPVSTTVLLNAVPFVARPGRGAPSLRELYPIPPEARVMLFAGSLRPNKNLEVLIEGFGEARLNGWVLAMLGEGSLYGPLVSLVRRLKLGDRVFLGRRSVERDLIGTAASADVGLLPYQGFGFNDEIATPNKLFEYIQARVPIATSRLPMIEQIISANGNGGFVDFTSPGSTASGLHDFVDLTLPGITADRKEAAAVQFSWENEEERLLGLFDSVIGSRPG
jgi:starch synthase